MELKLNKKEMEALLMEAIEKKYSLGFNALIIKAEYGYCNGVEFYYEEPAPVTDIKEAA